jgi:hypothetical protein
LAAIPWASFATSPTTRFGHQNQGDKNHDTRRHCRPETPTHQRPVGRREQHVQDERAHEPAAERPERIGQPEAQHENQQRGPLAPGVEERHAKE